MTALTPQTQLEIKKALRMHGFNPWKHSPDWAVASTAFELGATAERRRIADWLTGEGVRLTRSEGHDDQIAASLITAAEYLRQCDV